MYGHRRPLPGWPRRRRRAGRGSRARPRPRNPSSRMRSIALMVEPPVVTTSSTTRQRRAGRAAAPRSSATGRAPCAPCGRRTPSRRRPGQSGAGDRVGAHRDAADRRGAHGARLLGDELAERAKAVRQQDRPFGVDQVLGLAPLVSVTSPITSACSRSSAISRSRAAGSHRVRPAPRPWSQPSHQASG